MSSFADTIFALSSGGVPAGVAVLRISGRGARLAVERLVGEVPAPRSAALRSIRNRSGELLDRGLVLWFPGPASFTGEDCAELHVHGGKAVTAAIMRELGCEKGYRLAEAGEFTRRAFVNGKLDLPGAEALADLVAAETESQRRLAVLGGGLWSNATYADWSARLTQARAYVEAELDFSDEGDVPGDTAAHIWREIGNLAEEMRVHLAEFERAEIVRHGYRVVVAGPPNVGKSSLLNALARRDVAIVSDEPGTTRDLIEVALDLEGQKVVLVDTAGLRESDSVVERMGIQRARAAAASADLVLELREMPGWRLPDGNFEQEVIEGERMTVGTKCDLFDVVGDAVPEFRISAKTGDGINVLLGAIGRKARGAAGEFVSGAPGSARQQSAIAEAAGALEASCNAGLALELRAEEMRRADAALGRLVGRVGVEDVLGAIFARFCVGK